MKIPMTVGEIDKQWLSEALNTEVTACRVLDANSGTTGRGVLSVDYAVESGFPGRLFAKFPPTDELQRAFVTSSGMGRREARFYQQLSSEVPVRVPRGYFADSDDSGEQYIMLLEHLEDSHCSFQNASENYSLDYVRAVLASFAKLHAAYWRTPRFDSDLAWLAPPVQHEIAVDLVASALEQFSQDMPPTFQAMGELYLEHTDAIHKLWNEGEHTVIHGDVHDGNLFFDGAVPGFLDWALIARAPAMRDVGYFLAGTLSPEDRDVHQRDLLAYYRAQLLENGVSAPSLEELWSQYQWHAAYVWVGATVTLAMGDAWQPINYTRKTLERLNGALETLGSVEAIRSHI
ncbi:MAG: phosphotransferase [Halioglobus sp.]